MTTIPAQASKSGGEHRTTSRFFGGGRGPATTPFFSASVPQLQRQCTNCGTEAEQRIQPKLTSGTTRFFTPTTVPNLQRQLDDENEIARESPEGETLDLQSDNADTDTAPIPPDRDGGEVEEPSEIQSQLEIGAGDDPLEVEADAMADRVVQRQTAQPVGEQREVTAVQTKPKVRRATTDSRPQPSLGAEIAHARGTGTSLSPSVQASMEDAFDVDFSSVSVHTSAASAAMNESIGSRAFTHGTDIHFNSGEFAPSTQRGTHLLAHELTHVVQQNAGLRRKSKRSGGTAGPLQRPPGYSNGKIQTKLTAFGPVTGIPKGTPIHNLTLPLFVKKKINPDLWIEPPMPGAAKSGVARGKTGYADFYRDKTHNTTIGINEGKLGGFNNMGSAMAAPKPPLTPTGPIERLDSAPRDIELGDLKPGNSGEEDLGTNQIDNYSAGIKNTAAAVNTHQEDNAHKGRWEPTTSKMTSLTVPGKLAKSSKQGVLFSPLAMWEWRGKWKRLHNTPMKGSLVIYKSRIAGVWAYEWMPHKVPPKIGNNDVIALLGRLDNDVKPRLDSAKKPTPKLKDGAISGRLFPQHRPPRPRLVQRQPKNKKKFDSGAWQKAYNPWRTDADKVLGVSSGKRNDAVFEALTSGKRRTGVSLTIPAKVQERAKAFATVKHWFRFGKYYAWFRKTFDRVYVKLSAFGQSVKNKVKRLSKSIGGSRFGSWPKAAARAIFKVFKMLGSMAIARIADKLLDSLQQGVSSAIKKLVDAATPEAIKSKIEEIRELKETFDKVLAESQENLEKRLFGDKLEMFSKLDAFMQIAETVGTIVNVVKWGVRIMACASPPVLGCLWNLALAALEFAFAKIMQTCWFSAKVFKWIKDFNIRTVLDFPTNVARSIIEKANEVIPLPAGSGPVFAPIFINPNDFDIKCGSGRGSGDPMSPEQEALMQLVQEVGEKKFEAFMKMLAKRGAGPRVQLTVDRIQQFKPLIDSLTEQAMEDAAAGKATGITAPLEEFLKDIGTHTAAEKESIAARNIDYEKAQRSNPKFERDSIKWKPTLFVRKGVGSDSIEFADAIFDIQKMLGIEADGMAGAITTARFYERNGLAKDGVYRNAKEELEIQQIAEVMGSTFAHIDKLQTDLATLSWDMKPGHVKLITVDKRRILYTRTANGARLGAYYKTFLVSGKGKEKATRKVVTLSHFINLDPIKSGDGLGVFTTRTGSGKPKTEVGDTFIGDVTANSKLEVGSVFIGVAVDDF